MEREHSELNIPYINIACNALSTVFLSILEAVKSENSSLSGLSDIVSKAVLSFQCQIFFSDIAIDNVKRVYASTS